MLVSEGKFTMIKFSIFYLQWKWETIVMGFCFLIFLLVARFIVSIFLLPMNSSLSFYFVYL